MAEDPTLLDDVIARIRDGKSFTTRRVVGIQHGRAIFNLQASFHTVEPGLEHEVPMPEGLPDPESLVKKLQSMPVPAAASARPATPMPPRLPAGHRSRLRLRARASAAD